MFKLTANLIYGNSFQYIIFIYILLFSVKGITSRLKDSVNTASSLLDYYYSIGSLVLIKVMQQGAMSHTFFMSPAFFYIDLT